MSLLRETRLCGTWSEDLPPLGICGLCGEVSIEEAGKLRKASAEELDSVLNERQGSPVPVASAQEERIVFMGELGQGKTATMTEVSRIVCQTGCMQQSPMALD